MIALYRLCSVLRHLHDITGGSERLSRSGSAFEDELELHDPDVVD